MFFENAIFSFQISSDELKSKSLASRADIEKYRFTLEINSETTRTDDLPIEISYEYFGEVDLVNRRMRMETLVELEDGEEVFIENY